MQGNILLKKYNNRVSVKNEFHPDGIVGMFFLAQDILTSPHLIPELHPISKHARIQISPSPAGEGGIWVVVN